MGGVKREGEGGIWARESVRSPSPLSLIPVREIIFSLCCCDDIEIMSALLNSSSLN